MAAGVCVAAGWHAMGVGHTWWGSCVAGACVGACMAGGMHGRKNGNCSGRYASYWNAFLLFQVVKKPILWTHTGNSRLLKMKTQNTNSRLRIQTKTYYFKFPSTKAGTIDIQSPAY